MRFSFALSADSNVGDSTMFPILRASEAAVDVENIEVNPRHPNFAVDQGSIIHMGSIVPRINFTMRAAMSKGGIETDKLQVIKIDWFPIYVSFLDSLDAADSKTGTDIEAILQLQHDTTNKDTYPLYSGTDLASADTLPLSTVPFAEAFGDVGLTTNANLEDVAWDKDLFYDVFQYYTNSGMLSKVVGKMHTSILTRTKPMIYHSSNFTYPSVKRGNEYTSCFIMVNCSQAAADDQLFLAADVTAIPHVNFNVDIRYDEWNP